LPPTRFYLFEKHKKGEQSPMQNVIRAYKQENIEMAYQPIKELKSGKTLGYEALLRIQATKPEEFIAKAYKQGMLLDLEKQICKKIAQEFSSTQDDTVVFINLTPYSFAHQHPKRLSY
jgi:EAL domain-containing protein (putative c-di-GMP-specific phosphodiesterase class I)